MAGPFVPCKKNGASGYIFYTSLVSQANTKIMQASPTLAAGDFKVSIDGGALANLGTLPTNTPAASTMVKITLSQAEINGDNIDRKSTRLNSSHSQISYAVFCLNK